MKKEKTTRFATRAIHAGQPPDPLTGAVITPIYATSTYAQESPGKHKGLDYARSHNLTRYAYERCEIFTLAESLGGVESLIEHPAIMTHASVPAEVRGEIGISDALVRLSVGVEDVEDLIADLEQALGTEPMAFCRKPSFSASSASAVTATPPTRSEWPLRYFVAECTTMSKPCSSGRCTQGEANVLSATARMPFARATSATIARSTSFKSGLDGVSTQIIFVLGLIAASNSLRLASVE